VLVANVEELRYRVLLTDRQRLTEARYAVRNNQRGFLALPEGAASAARRAPAAARPGRWLCSSRWGPAR
jgi:hypothetical protein